MKTRVTIPISFSGEKSSEVKITPCAPQTIVLRCLRETEKPGSGCLGKYGQRQAKTLLENRDQNSHRAPANAGGPGA